MAPFSECGNSFAAFDSARWVSVKLAPMVTLRAVLSVLVVLLCARVLNVLAPPRRPKRPTYAAAEDGEDFSPDPRPEDIEDKEDAARQPNSP